MDWLRPGGVLQGSNIYFTKSAKVPFFQMYAKNLTLKTGLTNPMVDIRPLLNFIQKEKPRIDLVNTIIGKWEDATSELLKNTTKVILQRTPFY